MKLKITILSLVIGFIGCKEAEHSLYCDIVYDTEVIINSDSYTNQRNLIFSLNNEEECEAFIMKDIYVSIKNLKIEGENKIQLNITNTGDKILYEY